MKYFYILLSLTLFSMTAKSQGTLQFNQVVTITADTSFTNSGQGTWSYEFDLYEVPENIVAKVVKALNYKSTSGSSGSDNNVFVYTMNGIKTSDLTSTWVKAGDIIGAYVNFRTGYSDETCSQQDDMFISLIEYNIIPE